MNINYILSLNYYGNSVLNYFYAFIAFILSVFLLIIIKSIFTKHLKKLTDKTKIKTDDLVVDIVKALNWPLFILISWYVALKFISTPVILDRIVGYAAITLAAYYIVKFVQLIINFLTEQILKDKSKDKVDKTVIDFISKTIKVVVWVVALLIIVQNLGYDITTLVAGLGVGGIAVAFALQNVLKDLFASLSIFFDKPFKVGDYISVGKDQGDVKSIGLKSTHIKTLEGDTLIISNKEIAESRVHNYHKMERRRAAFKIGVSYETPNPKLKKIPRIIEGIITDIDDVKFGRVHFKKFGDYALIFNVVYSVLSRKYVKYLNINQEINYKIRDSFEKEGIEMAYPTQTLYIKNK